MTSDVVLVLVLAGILTIFYWVFLAIQDKRDETGRMMMRMGYFGKWKKTPLKKWEREGLGQK